MSNENDSREDFFDDDSLWLYDGKSYPGSDLSDIWSNQSYDEKVPECRHDWKYYKGFHMEEYYYCTKCDAKKPVE